MSDAQHTPPGDASFRASVVRQVGGAVALVALVAAIFWAIGSIGGSDPPVVADLPGSSGVDEDDGTGAPEDGTDATDGEADDASDDAPDDAPADDAGAEEPEDGSDEGDADPEPDGEGDADADAADDGDRDDTGDRAVDPADVSVQVLDGVKTDGGAAADGVAAEIESAGYRIVARNIALDYEVTTVLYNPGNEVAAEQLAADIGGAEVRPQPGNLSDQVDLHVVVGRDRA